MEEGFAVDDGLLLLSETPSCSGNDRILPYTPADNTVYSLLPYTLNTVDTLINVPLFEIISVSSFFV